MSFVYESERERSWLPPWLVHQNRARYAWAAQFVGGKAVVEVGCGDGAGTQKLHAAGALRVHGFDVSRPAIAIAQAETSEVEGLHFAAYDGLRLPIDGETCDIAISLETIEHVENDGLFVAEIARTLKPQGMFLCSTPNRELLDPGTSIGDAPFNRHHVREYTASELRCRLEARFGDVEIVGQTSFPVAYCWLLNRIGALMPRLAVRAHQATKVLWSPMDRASRHRPGPSRRGFVPEVLIATCRHPRRG